MRINWRLLRIELRSQVLAERRSTSWWHLSWSILCSFLEVNLQSSTFKLMIINDVVCWAIDIQVSRISFHHQDISWSDLLARLELVHWSRLQQRQLIYLWRKLSYLSVIRTLSLIISDCNFTCSCKTLDRLIFSFWYATRRCFSTYWELNFNHSRRKKIEIRSIWHFLISWIPKIAFKFSSHIHDSKCSLLMLYRVIRSQTSRLLNSLDVSNHWERRRCI